MKIFNKLIYAGLLAIMPLSVTSLHAQETQNVDEEFVKKVRAAILQDPNVILEAAQLAQNQARLEQEKRQAEAAVAVREELSAQNTPGFVIGNPNGTKTVIEFLDYRCGFCKRAHDDVEFLIQNDPKTRFVIMMMPVLGPQSETLARFAIAAGDQDKFKEAHDYIFANNIDLTDEGFSAASKAIGIDWNVARSHMTSPSASTVLENHREYVTRMGIGGTPFFITPKNTISGAPSREQLILAANE